MEKIKTYIIEGTLKSIYKILLDLNLYGTLHPLIQRTEKLSLQRQGQLYKVIERPFSWVPFNIQYKVNVKESIEGIDYEIFEIPLTQAFINYKLVKESEGITRVQFQLRIESIVIGRKLLMKKMIDAQDRLMSLIQIEIGKNVS